jgi:hypothetical protein
MSFGKSSPPPAPDYAGAARTQGASNVQTAIAEGILNRPNEITPYGSRTWQQVGSQTVNSSDPSLQPVDVPLYQSNVNLTPLGQQRFDQEQRIIGNLGNVAESGLDRVSSAVNSPFSVDSATQLQDRAEQAFMSRLEPRFAQQEEAIRTRLLQNGIQPGSEAWRREFETFNQGRNDARQQAVIAGMQTRPQALQEEMTLRQMPLNELNALRTGSQVNLPQFGGTAPYQVGAAPIMQGAMAQGQADQNRYNAQVAQQNAFTSGLFGMGAAGMPLFF